MLDRKASYYLKDCEGLPFSQLAFETLGARQIFDRREWPRDSGTLGTPYSIWPILLTRLDKNAKFARRLHLRTGNIISTMEPSVVPNVKLFSGDVGGVEIDWAWIFQCLPVCQEQILALLIIETLKNARNAGLSSA